MIGAYPIMAIIIISAIIFLLGPVIFSLIIGMIIVVPIYLAVQIFGDRK